MKILFSGTFLLISLLNQAQRNIKDSLLFDDIGQGYFEKIIDIEGSKDDLFTKAVLWINKSFESSKAVTQTSDREAGILIIKGTTQYQFYRTRVSKKKLNTNEQLSQDKVSFTLKFFLKDNRVKLVISDITMVNAFGFNFLDLPITNKAIDYAIDQTLSTKLDDRAEGLTKLSQFEGFNREASILLSAIEIHMRKKSEADF